MLPKLLKVEKDRVVNQKNKMSKYNLSELLTEIVGGRIGTLNISARDLVSKMEELEDKGVRVERFDGLSADGKTYIEFHVHPMRKYDEDYSFSVYDFKFGFDPMSEDHFMEEYPFSIGGRSSALDSAETTLRGGDTGYQIDEIDIDSIQNDPGSGDADNPTGEDLEASGGYDAAMEESHCYDEDDINEGEFDEARQAAIESSQEAAGIKENMYIDDDEFEMEMGRSKKDSLKKEMAIHVDQLLDGNIDMNDFMNVVEDIMAELGLKEVMGVDRKGNKKPDTDGSDATKFKKAAMSEDEKKYTDTVAKMLKDRILKDIPMDVIIDFVKTHGSDIRRMNNSEIKDEFEEFRSVNYDYIDENLKAHFNRFK